MRRREFITLLGGAAVGVAARGARAARQPMYPPSGFSTATSADTIAPIGCVRFGKA